MGLAYDYVVFMVRFWIKFKLRLSINLRLRVRYRVVLVVMIRVMLWVWFRAVFRVKVVLFPIVRRCRSE